MIYYLNMTIKQQKNIALIAQPHDSDVKALLRIAQVYDIPIANNISTADFILHSTLMNEEYSHQVENFRNTVENRARELGNIQ